MANYKSLKTTINANVKRNGNQEITGQILNSVLTAMVDTLGTGYSFAGVATPATNPGTPDAMVFYIANGKGSYTHFGELEVTEDEVVVLYWDSAWHKVATGIAREGRLTEMGKEIDTKQNALTDTDGGYGQRVAELEKGKQDTLTAGNGISIVGGVISSSVAEVVDNIVNAGYVFAGVATPATDPSTPNAKVFYIANGKGTYTNFGSIEVTEDEVVVLKYDTAWHKVATGIASDKKLTELEQEVTGLPLSGEKSTEGAVFYDYAFKQGIKYILKNTGEHPINASTRINASSSENVDTIVTNQGLASGSQITFTASGDAGVLRIYFLLGGSSFTIQHEESVYNTIEQLDKRITPQVGRLRQLVGDNNLVLEQGILDGETGVEQTSATRIRTLYLRPPFSVTTKSGYVIRTSHRYSSIDTSTNIANTSVASSSYSVDNGLDFYRLVIRRTDDGAISPSDDCIDSFTMGVLPLVNQNTNGLAGIGKRVFDLESIVLGEAKDWNGVGNGSSSVQIQLGQLIKGIKYNINLDVTDFQTDDIGVQAGWLKFGVYKDSAEPENLAFPYIRINGTLQNTYSFVAEENDHYFIMLRAKSGLAVSGNIEVAKDSAIFSKGYVSPSGSDDGDGTESHPLATINKAISLGFKNIELAPGHYVGQKLNIENNSDIKIVCNAHSQSVSMLDNRTRRSRAIFDNSVNVENLVAYGSIYRTPLSVGEDHTFTKVFITQTLPPVYTAPDYYGRTPTYNALLWEIVDNILDCKKVVPVLTLAECQSTNGTFFYDGTYLYVNPYGGTITSKTYKRLYFDEITSEGGVIKNVTNMVMENVDFIFFPNHGCNFTYCTDLVVKNCGFGFSAISSAAYIYDTDAEYFSCDAYHAGSDGFGIVGYGNASFFNCNGIHCYDDGVSHHDGCAGVIDGGYWAYNGKGGVAPTYGSKVNVQNVVSENNVYGLYLVADDTRNSENVALIQNSVFVNNTFKDIDVAYYKAIIHHCVFDPNMILITDTAEVTQYANTER